MGTPDTLVQGILDFRKSERRWIAGPWALSSKGTPPWRAKGELIRGAYSPARRAARR